MVSEEIVHIIPVGFEEDRAIYGLMKLGATRIHLLLDEKADSWGENARRHAARVKERLNQVIFDSTNIYEVFFDPTSSNINEPGICPAEWKRTS